MRGPDEELRKSLEQQRGRFLEAVASLRPRLHRYCSRMLGSPLDGEDAVQETLAKGFYNLPELREPRDLQAWLFRIAHNACIDELRRRRSKREESIEGEPEGAPREDPVLRGQELEQALRLMVHRLPPKERAALVLKDVLEFSLREIAGIIDSTEGGVKAALHRGRGKLADAQHQPAPEPSRLEPADRALLEQYATRFQARDWSGLVELLRSDARLEVVEIFDSHGHDGFTSRYFFNYSRLDFQWRCRPSRLEGAPVLAIDRLEEGRWGLFSLIRLDLRQGRVAGVRDYLHVPRYLFEELEGAV
ncbi:hypothetical protein ABI59_08495 [Acidobacteria bacterium Mor1]|nr:hypothetical protein ABI59_08495 [Acidobacteria bacterium Mor1]